MAQMEIPPVLGTTNENDDSVPVPLYQCWDALAADMSAFTGQQSQLPSAFEVFGRKNTDTATPSIDGFAALFEGFHLLLHSLHSSNDRLASVGDELVRVKADFLHSLTREKKLRSEVERLQRLNFNAQAKLLQAQQRLEEVERLGKDRQRELRRVTSSSKLGTSPKSPVIIQFPTTTNTSSTTTTTRVLVEMDASFFEDWTRHHRQFSAESPATSPALLSSSVSSPASSSTSCAAMKKSHSSAYLNSPPAMKKLPSSAYLNSPPATPPSSRRRNSFVSSSSLPGSPPSTSNNAAINVMHNILHQQSLLLEAIMSSPSSFPPPPPSPLEQEDEISIHHQTLLVNDSRRKELENERNEISKEWKRVGEERVKVDKERETFQIEKEAFEEEVRSFWLSDEVWSRVAAIQKEETSTPPLPPPPLDDSQLLLKTVCDEAVTASSLSFSSSPSLLLQSSFPSLGTIVLPPHDPLQSVRVEGSIPPSELSMNGSSFPVLLDSMSSTVRAKIERLNSISSPTSPTSPTRGSGVMSQSSSPPTSPAAKIFSLNKSKFSPSPKATASSSIQDKFGGGGGVSPSISSSSLQNNSISVIKDTHDSPHDIIDSYSSNAHDIVTSTLFAPMKSRSRAPSITTASLPNFNVDAADSLSSGTAASSTTPTPSMHTAHSISSISPSALHHHQQQQQQVSSHSPSPSTSSHHSHLQHPHHPHQEISIKSVMRAQHMHHHQQQQQQLSHHQLHQKASSQPLLNEHHLQTTISSSFANQSNLVSSAAAIVMSSPHHHHGSDDVIIIGGSGSDVSSSLPHHETILSHAASSPDILNLNKPTSSLHTASIELQQQQNQLQSQLSVSLKETTNSEFSLKKSPSSGSTNRPRGSVNVNSSAKESKKFAKLFPSIEHQADSLVNVYNCALEKDVLWQGKLYIASECIAFHGNIFGKAVETIIFFHDVISIEKKSTAGMFPNAIRICTTSKNYTFASFMKRDAAFADISELWKASSNDSIKELTSSSNFTGKSSPPRSAPLSRFVVGNGGFDSSGSSDLQLHDPSVPPSKDSLLSIEDKSLRGGGGVGSSSSQVFFSVLETSETNSSTYTTSGQQQQTGGGIPVSTTPTSIKADISMAKLEVGGSSGGSSNLLERKKSTSKRTSFQFVKSKIETSSPSLLDTSENNSASSDCESVDLMNTVATPAPQTPPLQAATLVASNSVTAFPNSSASSGSSAVSSTYASNSSSSNHVHNNSIVVSNLASKKKDSKEKSVMNNVSDLFKRKRSLTSPNHPGFNDARLAKSTIQANEKIGPDALPHPGFAPNDSFSSSLSNSFKLPQDDIYKEDDTPKAIITGLNNSGGGGERSKTSTTTTLSSTTTATAEVSIIPASSLPLFSSSPLSSLSSRDSTPLLQPSAIPSPNDNAGSKSLEDLTVVKLDVPASCDCGTHTGTVLLDEIFDIELSELWSAMFGRPDCLFKMVLAKREAENIKIGEWHVDSVTKKSAREISCIVPLKMSLFQKSTSLTLERQKILKSEAQFYVVESISKTPKVAYGENYSILCRYCVTHHGEGRARLRIVCKIEFTKKPLFKEKLESSVISQMQSFIKDLQTCIKSTFKTATGNNLASTKLDTFSKSSDSLRQIHLSSGSISSSNNNNSNSNINSSKIKSNVDEKDTHSTFSESLIDFGIRGINMISLNFSEPFARGDQDQHTRNKRKSFNFVSIGAIFGIVMTILNLIWIQRLGAKIETIFVEMGNVHQKVEYRHGKLGPVDQDPITAEEFSEAFNSVLKTQIDEINNHVHALEGIFTASNSQIESIHEDFVKIEETLK